MKTFKLKRKRRLPQWDKTEPVRFATAVSLESHLVCSLVRIHTVNQDGSQADRVEDWLLADAPEWAREICFKELGV